LKELKGCLSDVPCVQVDQDRSKGAHRSQYSKTGAELEMELGGANITLEHAQKRSVDSLCSFNYCIRPLAPGLLRNEAELHVREYS
jgi:hypothetical protein